MSKKFFFSRENPIEKLGVNTKIVRNDSLIRPIFMVRGVTPQKAGHDGLVEIVDLCFYLDHHSLYR
jgi:hypothetical protein